MLTVTANKATILALPRVTHKLQLYNTSMPFLLGTNTIITILLMFYNVVR